MSNKRPLHNIDYDDVDQVERFLTQVQRKKERKEAMAEQARNIGKDESTLIAEITADVEQILLNIANGDCPYIQLTNAYVMIQKPYELGGKDAVCVLLNYEGLQITTDARLFENLCGVGGISEDLEQLELDYKTPSAAIPKLMQIAVSDGNVDLAHAARLTSLYQVWLREVSWDKCFINGINRPSLPSWAGYPWQAFNFQDRSLNRNIRSKNVVVKVAMETPLMCNLNPLVYKCIWSRRAGRLPNIRGALTSCIEGYKVYERQTIPDGTKVCQPNKEASEKKTTLNSSHKSASAIDVIRSHTCAICGNGFVQKQSLQRHMREVHKIQPTKPPSHMSK